jgi:hypothetical protein
MKIAIFIACLFLAVETGDGFIARDYDQDPAVVCEGGVVFVAEETPFVKEL